MDKSNRLHTTLQMVMLGTSLLQVALSGVLLMKINAMERLATQAAQPVGPLTFGTLPVIAGVSAEGAPTQGPDDAAVTIVVFSDFGCSACRQVWLTLDELLELYPEQVRVAYRAFPPGGDSSSVSMQAANAAFCAGEQGLFWEMHRVLFERQEEVGEGNLATYGRGIGVDMETFGECLEELRYADQIESDVMAGVVAGVQALPTAFVNGRLTVGTMPLQQFRDLVDLALEEAESVD